MPRHGDRHQAGSPAGFLIDTANLGGTTTSWSAAGLPSTDAVLYFDDVDCTGGASGTCSAVGATPTGAVVAHLDQRARRAAGPT